MRPELARIRDDLENQRLNGMARFALHLAEAGALRTGSRSRKARDFLWTIISHAVHSMLVTDRGWLAERYRNWLAETLACALLSS